MRVLPKPCKPPSAKKSPAPSPPSTAVLTPKPPTRPSWICGTRKRKTAKNAGTASAWARPLRAKKVSLAAEINFPSDGINRALSGAFAAAENGDILVLHRGKIRGGKALFFKYYTGKTITADDGGKPDTFALIGSLNDTNFPAKLAAFVRQILDIKAAAKRDAA